MEKFYWNSKLQRERYQLVRNFNKGDVVCDVFCGCGPISLLALKNGCTVYCNDLNKDAILCLEENLKINKLEGNIEISNLEGKEFLKKIIGENRKINHFVLNLPEISLEYLKIFRALNYPFLDSLIHCYFFCKYFDRPVDLIRSNIGLNAGNGTFKCIRSVSPSKNMWKLSIYLKDLLLGFD
jgi:tRNA (guanine37-N1)-methyltransferase